MTPALKVSLTLTAVLAAGLPLLWLTASPPAATPQQSTAPGAPGLRRVNASLYFSGEPRSITLWHAAEELIHFDSPVGPCHFTLNLPIDDSTEIEYEINWLNGTPGMKGCTLYLEPEGLDTRSESMWTMPEDNLLHDIFYFRW